MKDGIENSWAPHPGFELPPSAQQAGTLPLDHSALIMVSHDGPIQILGAGCFSGIPYGLLYY